MILSGGMVGLKHKNTDRLLSTYFSPSIVLSLPASGRLTVPRPPRWGRTPPRMASEG